MHVVSVPVLRGALLALYVLKAVLALISARQGGRARLRLIAIEFMLATTVAASIVRPLRRERDQPIAQSQ
jgi:hypothetical protein